VCNIFDIYETFIEVGYFLLNVKNKTTASNLHLRLSSVLEQ